LLLLTTIGRRRLIQRGSGTAAARQPGKAKAALAVLLTLALSVVLDASPGLRTSAAAATTGNLVANGDLAAGSSAPDCFQYGSWGTSTSTSTFSADVPAGASGRSWVQTVTEYTSGDVKILPSDAAGCAPLWKPVRDTPSAPIPEHRDGGLGASLHDDTHQWMDVLDDDSDPGTQCHVADGEPAPAPAAGRRYATDLRLGARQHRNSVHDGLPHPADGSTASTHAARWARGDWALVDRELLDDGALQSQHLLTNGKILLAGRKR
jgi:hypothetical protein